MSSDRNKEEDFQENFEIVCNLIEISNSVERSAKTTENIKKINENTIEKIKNIRERLNQNRRAL